MAALKYILLDKIGFTTCFQNQMTLLSTYSTFINLCVCHPLLKLVKTSRWTEQTNTPFKKSSFLHFILFFFWRGHIFPRKCGNVDHKPAPGLHITIPRHLPHTNWHIHLHYPSTPFKVFYRWIQGRTRTESIACVASVYECECDFAESNNTRLEPYFMVSSTRIESFPSGLVHSGGPRKWKKIQIHSWGDWSAILWLHFIYNNI